MLKLADVLVNYACGLKAQENILIEATDIPPEFTNALVRTARAAGGRPFVWLKSGVVQRGLMLAGSEEQWSAVADVEAGLMQRMQCYLGVRGSHNVSELGDVPAELQKLYESSSEPRTS